jgi:uncharacterized membrane protein YraQ (UPF0718 family)
MLRHKRLLLTALVVLGLGASFWSQSRYPALDEKATMADDIRLEDPLGFDVLYPIVQSDPFWQKVLETTANWGYTNRKGMVFGVLFGAALMSLFSLLSRRTYRSGIANSSLGIVIGAPLGVCVNCATPIAQAIHSGGARLETTLATMVSSPTLNVVVVTMLFSLFPSYMIALKLGLTLTFILVAIPLIARYLGRHATGSLASDLTISTQVCPIDLSAPVDPNERWSSALAWTGRAFAKNLWWVGKRTVPLMIFAGFLGALLITVVPWDTMAGLFEDRGGRLVKFVGETGVVVIGMSIVTAIGLFLPVPMTFDVIMTAILMSAGVPVHYAMVLLFTLGIFSVYSFSIVCTEIAPRVAVACVAVLGLLGVAGGLAARQLHAWEVAKRTGIVIEAFRAENAPPATPPAQRHPARTYDELQAELARTLVVPDTSSRRGDLQVERRAFRPRTGGAPLAFQKSLGEKYGLDEPYESSLLRCERPYEYHRPIAAGDVHDDGWPDVVVGSDRGGVSLYSNVAGRFERQELDLPELRDAFVGLVALVDLNDDGWLDLFATSYRRGNFVVYNQHGRFPKENLRPLPNVDTETTLTAAAAFADLERDGDLDAVLGNWSRWEGLPESRDALLLAEGGEFRLEPLEGMVGETLSTLFTDIDADGNLDLIVGNDFVHPDLYFLGDGKGKLRLVTAADQLIPLTTETTMSIASADLDNDLVPEIFLAQVTGRGTQGGHARSTSPLGLCRGLPDGMDRARCRAEADSFLLVRRSRTGRDTARCLALPEARQRDECIAVHVVSSARWSHDERICGYLPERYADLAAQCRAGFAKRIRYSDEEYRRNIRQIRNFNVLLVRGTNGRYEDRAQASGLGVTGWTWNAKFADLDLDGFQDLFAVNGIYGAKERESNYVFRNQGATRFVDATLEAGVEDYYPTSGYSYVDFDRDGDLDVIAVAINGPIWVYENRTGAGSAIAFELRDERGNRFGIGSRVVVHHGPGGSRHQVREIQAGGGFISFDPYVAHFGLGADDRVEGVEVLWSTGERSALDGDFPAGATYRITRPADARGDATPTARSAKAKLRPNSLL